MLVSTPRGRISATRSPRGVPLVLLHPLAMSAALWQPVAPALRESVDVIAVDARGHGDSDWDGEPFSVEDMADDLAALLDALQLPVVDIAGLSMGGCTALSFALRHPDRMRRLVLADTTACYGPAGERQRRWEERAQRILAVDRRELLDFQLDRWFTDGFRAAAPDVVDHAVSVFLGTDSQAHAAACRALGAFDVEAALGDVRAETLVLVGEQDYATPPSMARTLAEGISAARLRVIDACRHMSLIERPEIWADIARHLGASEPDPVASATAAR